MPVVGRFAERSYDHTLREQASIFLQHICYTSAACMQLLVACQVNDCWPQRESCYCCQNSSTHVQFFRSCSCLHSRKIATLGQSLKTRRLILFCMGPGRLLLGY